MREHSPTPWQISDVRTTDDTAMIVGGAGFEFGLIADVTEDVDAAFIVKAVNAHDALVKALRMQEDAELAHANCEECGGEEVPELCPKCFPLFDDARITRRLLIASIKERA